MRKLLFCGLVILLLTTAIPGLVVVNHIQQVTASFWLTPYFVWVAVNILVVWNMAQVSKAIWPDALGKS